MIVLNSKFKIRRQTEAVKEAKRGVMGGAGEKRMRMMESRNEERRRGINVG